MQIAIFGASGKTGHSILEEALKQGHIVTAFTRNANKISIKAENLRIVTGDVLDRIAVSKAVEGQDAVLCALGTGRDLSPTTVLSQGTKNITDAMEKHHVSRIICLLSGWLLFEYYPPIFKDITEEHERQLAVLKQSSVEWVAVCPPQITNFPASGEYRVGIDYLPRNGTQISKFDIAEFMLLQLLGNDYLYKAVGISN